jgi:multiple sugar transport system substrate-binding protein
MQLGYIIKKISRMYYNKIKPLKNKFTFENCMKILYTVFIILSLASCTTFTYGTIPEPVTVRFSYMSEIPEYDLLIQQFQEENPDIRIEIIHSEGGQRFNPDDILENADVVRLSSEFINNERLSLLNPLDEWISIDPQFDRSEFLNGSMQALQINGNQMGIPAGISPMVLYYQDLRFSIAKTIPPDSILTIDEFVIAAEKVNNQDPNAFNPGEFSYGFCTAPEKEDILIFTYLFGGGIFDHFPNPTIPTLNRTENVNALDWYAKLYREYKIVPPVSTEGSERDYQIYQYIQNFQCGFWMNWLSQFSFSEDYTTNPHPIPLPKATNSINIAILDGYFIIKNSKNTDAAWKWISFLSRQLTASGNQIPPLYQQISSHEYKTQVSSEIFSIANTLQKDTMYVNFESFQDEKISQVIQLFYEAVNLVIRNGRDAQDALDFAQGQAINIFSSP